MSLLIISGSSRENGNAEYLAKEAVASYKGEVKWIQLREHTIQQITDQRHDANGFEHVNDDHSSIVEEMIKADEILFATPLYWYGMSGHMKTFIDRWSQALRDDSLNFKKSMSGKPSYVITCGGDQVQLKALPLILQFRHIFEFMGMDFKKYFIGEARKPGDAADNVEQLKKVADFFI
ncbi:flavodoxin family protein [Jeotgalibacillus sp. R-1-5s-1]|uniref:flavodoxin family protein n=1 Tax=Jeotgalibacillus sp. R-1-5s-1 TaxID=2555897 RepID=UPI00106CA90D|nr:flavodoxin family protein [Jeotgalibacillus sp. R-1-5s-1]TFD91891.1 flavodoxin family protein [Jeotgalibacillus sp. R-1-5s-1]